MLRSLALALALSVFLAPRAVLAQSTRAGKDFVVDQWTTDDGLPLKHVTDIAFGPDGFVWVATFEGLVRFDGVRFTPMDNAWISALGSRRIHRVITHPVDGALWVLAERRAVGRYADGRLQVWDGLRDLGGLPLDWSIEPDGLWLWGDGGIFRLEDAPVRAPWVENYGKSDGIASAGDATLFTAQGGAVFLARAQGGVRRLGEEDGVHGASRSLRRTPAGRTWLETEVGHRTWDGARFVPAATEDLRMCRITRESTPPPSCPPRGAPESSWRLDGRTVQYDGREVWQLHAPPLETVLDPRGDLWIMTFGEGLIRIRPAVLRHLAVSATEPWVDRLWLDSGDRLWAQGAIGWGAFDPARRETAGAGIFLTPPSFGYPTELSGGRVLLYHAGQRRVVRLDGDTFRVESQAGSPLRGACTQLRLRDGRNLLGGDTGLLVLAGDVPVPLAVEGDLAAIRAMLELDDGEVVLGTHGGGLQVLDLERRVRSVEDSGLTVDNIRHIRRDGDTLWVSTEDEGLCAVGPVSRGLVDPQWRCFHPAGTVRGVHASEVDGAGQIWLSSNVGLWVGREDAFTAFAHGGPRPELLHLGTHAGMVNAEANGPSCGTVVRDRAGVVWFPTQDEDDRPHEGSGVGLAIARELTELCGGEIGVDPREGGGARFWFTLPRGAGHLLSDEVATAADVGAAAAAGDAGLVGPTDAPLVLVVEDHADMRAWLVEELSEGFRVATAADGAEGLARALELRPALVVSDIMMPRMDGLSLARELRQHEGAPPILLVSAKVSGVDSASVSATADGWLPKPFSSTALRAEVQRLTRSEARRPGCTEQPVTADDRRLLTRLAAAVDARLADESLSVPELARAVATSERTLHRELVRLTGVSPSRWIREHRLGRAAEMLSRGEFRTVSEAAAAVGMSRAWFTRAYRAWSGRSPGEDVPEDP